MISSQLAPGVYFEKVETGISPIYRARMDIPGFVGICEKGPIDKPLRIDSLKEFKFHFGNPIPNGMLAYSVRGFFENGGQTCYVTRVADTVKAKCASKILYDQNNESGGLSLYSIKINAINEGRWGNSIEIDIKSSSLASSTNSGFPDDEPDEGYISALLRSVKYFEKGSVVKITYTDQKGEGKQEIVELSEVDSSSGLIKWNSKKLQNADGNDVIINTLKNVDKSEDITFSTMEFDLVFSYKIEIKENFTFLSMSPSHPNYFVDMINGRSNLVTVEDMDSITKVPYNMPKLMKKPDGTTLDNQLVDGEDGIKTISKEDFTGSDISIRGLRAFEFIDEVTSIAMPDIVYSQKTVMWSKKQSDPCVEDVFESGEVYSTHSLCESDIDDIHRDLIMQCEKLGDRVAVLDFPDGLEIDELLIWRKKYDSKYVFVYYPWLEVHDPLNLDETGSRLIPPSGHVLGIFAKSDAAHGAHKAPANEKIKNCTGLEIDISDSQQARLNGEGINCIRSFPGRGIRVWGARTLSYDPMWRYVNVRRLIIMIEKSIDQSTKWAVFEPNDFNLRLGIQSTVTLFLRDIWKEGGLAGATQNEAFVVICDERNNPPAMIDEGQLITEIRLAPSVPSEFITVRILRSEGAAEVMEA